MPAIDVAPESLVDLGRKLNLAAQAAALVEVQGLVHFRVSEREAGDVRLAAALTSFIRGWSHGCQLLRDDAATLADLLSQAGTVYLDVESAIAGEQR